MFNSAILRYKADFFLAAVFLWITPLEAALSIALIAFFKAIFIASGSADFRASPNFLTEYLICDLTNWFLRVLLMVWRTLFLADAIFGKLFHPLKIYGYFIISYIKMQGTTKGYVTVYYKKLEVNIITEIY